MRAFFRLLTIIPSRPQASQRTAWVCVCVCAHTHHYEAYSVLWLWLWSKQVVGFFFVLFFRGFTLPFLTVLNAPSPFVNTCLSSSEPVCFAMKEFFVPLSYLEILLSVLYPSTYQTYHRKEWEVEGATWRESRYRETSECCHGALLSPSLLPHPPVY